MRLKSLLGRQDMEQNSRSERALLTCSSSGPSGGTAKYGAIRLLFGTPEYSFTTRSSSSSSDSDRINPMSQIFTD